MVIFIRKKDYDAIKSGEETEIMVEAQGREPMCVYIRKDKVEEDEGQIFKHYYQLRLSLYLSLLYRQK